MNIFRIIINLIVLLLPWPLRRVILNKLFGYKISTTARIGFSMIIPRHLEMGDGAIIGHLTVCKNLNRLSLGAFSSIGNLNWISGCPMDNKDFFSHRFLRDPSLYLGSHSAITHRHLLDCTDKIFIGEFTTIAGSNSQFLTHSIDMLAARQDCEPIVIGSYCFIGTECVLLPGVTTADYCVFGAKALLNSTYDAKFALYGGVPASFIKSLPVEAGYFNRTTGFIN